MQLYRTRDLRVHWRMDCVFLAMYIYYANLGMYAYAYMHGVFSGPSV